MNSKQLKENIYEHIAYYLGVQSEVDDCIDAIMQDIKNHVDYLEIWKPILGYPDYEVSTLGNIRLKLAYGWPKHCGYTIGWFSGAFYERYIR